MSEQQDLTWREAEDVMAGGGECIAVTFDKCHTKEWRMRIRGELEFYDGTLWLVCGWNYGTLKQTKWRRVPTVPRVSGLAAKWRAMTPTCLSAYTTCADELEQALAADDMVSLKSVTAQELWEVWYKNNNCVTGFEDVMTYLRKRAAK